ncbi:MAG: hypothetical protein KDI52_12800 [Xanthomonadales bacterium]|nr:hypothetical protein [Xanthomonadales bacterium]
MILTLIPEGLRENSFLKNFSPCAMLSRDDGEGCHFTRSNALRWSEYIQV